MADLAWVNGNSAVIESTNPSITVYTNSAINVADFTASNGVVILGAGGNRIVTITGAGSGDLTVGTTVSAAGQVARITLTGATAWKGTLATSGSGEAFFNQFRINAETAVGSTTKINLNGTQQLQFNATSSGSTFTVGELKGTAGTANISTNGTTTLRVVQSTNTTFAGTFTKGGAGLSALTKAGTGSLTLSGANTVDQTTVESGGLLVTGSLSGAVTVANGTFLGGSGSVGAVSLKNGAIIQYALGGSNLTMTSLLQGEAGTYIFDFNGSGLTGTTYTLNSMIGHGFTRSSFSYTNLASGLRGSFSLNGSVLTFTTSEL
jgi:hypothetical protein